jgi:hypothetical protein
MPAPTIPPMPMETAAANPIRFSDVWSEFLSAIFVGSVAMQS